MSRRKRMLRGAVLAGALGFSLLTGGVYAYAGQYGLHVLFGNGGTWWPHMRADDPRLSPAIRLALQEAPPASAGEMEWRQVAPGFEAAELPVLADGAEVERIFLARIDPAKFRFEVRNSPPGDKDLDGWMAASGAALIINGSYYAKNGRPDTPVLSQGKPLGPLDYDAEAGAFVASDTGTGLSDLTSRDWTGKDWRQAFKGASNAMVSFPLLIAADGSLQVAKPSRWLANRSFVGQDQDGLIVLGTTRDGFFSLDRLATFLRQSPLGLTLALNLDGGPVACQGISLNGFERRVYGRWELRVQDDDVRLLTWPYGTIGMPVVLAVFPYVK